MGVHRRRVKHLPGDQQIWGSAPCFNIRIAALTGRHRSFHSTPRDDPSPSRCSSIRRAQVNATTCSAISAKRAPLSRATNPNRGGCVNSLRMHPRISTRVCARPHPFDRTNTPPNRSDGLHSLVGRRPALPNCRLNQKIPQPILRILPDTCAALLWTSATGQHVTRFRWIASLNVDGWSR